MEDILITQQK